MAIFSGSRRIWLGLLILVISSALSIFLGNGAVSTGRLFHALVANGADETAATILFHARIPRTVAAFLCGSALAVAGLLLQAALHNNLASPGIMGVNSGAGFFVLLSALFFPFQTLLRSVFAFVGAMCASLFAYLISYRSGVGRSMLILSGVAVSALMSAGINAVITLFPETVTDRAAFSLGGLQGVALTQLAVSAVFIIPALAGAFALGGGIDLFALGDETAQGLGLNVRSYRLLTVLCAAVLASAAVSVCGLLGFVGLIVPNIVRLSGEASCRHRILVCVLWGGAFLIVCDLLSRNLFYPYELPAGLLLSILGAPFFIFMLMHRKRGFRDD